MLIDLSLMVNPLNAEQKLGQMGHYGTHIDMMDSPSIPIDHFFCDTLLIDISDIRDAPIEPEHLKHHDIRENDFVIFRAHWLRDFSYATKAYLSNHPHFSDEAIDFLISKKIRFMGLDFPGAQRHEKHKIVDQKCAKHQIFIIENLNQLEEITQKRFKTYCFPMPFKGMTGIPIRVVAEVREL
jgi:kynurenine formamidase